MPRTLPAIVLLLALALLALPAPATAVGKADVTIGFLPATTRSEEIMLRGTAPRGEMLEISVNGRAQVEVVAKSAMDVYNVPVTLAAGQNRIEARLKTSGARAHAAIFRITATFRDLADEKLTEDIEVLATLGLVSGMGDGRFNPSGAVTRAQFAKMLVMVLDLPLLEDGALTFRDDARIPAWARPYVVTAVKHELMKGFPDGSFGPEQPVTRMQLVVMASRGLKLKAPAHAGKEQTKEQTKEHRFKDDVKVPAWARADLDTAAGAGVVGEYLGAELKPDAAATRAETAAALRRLRDVTRP